MECFERRKKVEWNNGRNKTPWRQTGNKRVKGFIESRKKEKKEENGKFVCPVFQNCDSFYNLKPIIYCREKERKREILVIFG